MTPNEIPAKQLILPAPKVIAPLLVSACQVLDHWDRALDLSYASGWFSEDVYLSLKARIKEVGYDVLSHIAGGYPTVPELVEKARTVAQIIQQAHKAQSQKRGHGE